jgi:hypothetical protein
MRTSTCVAYVLAVLVAACGGGREPIDLGPDAEELAREGCDPIAQRGCELGEKCANRIESLEPFSSTGECVPDGQRAAGEACALVGDPRDGEGYDDCQAGLSCQNRRCTPICDLRAAGGCDQVGGLCVGVSQFFEDHVGLCADTCHPVKQDCKFAFDDEEGGDEQGDDEQGGDEEGDDEQGDDEQGGPIGACYFHPDHNESVCLRTATDAVSRAQGSECLGPLAGRGFLNGCAPGHGCLLPKSRDRVECVFFCEPTEALDGAPCAAEGGPGAEGFECRYLSGWLGYQADVIPRDIGVCIPTDLADLPSCAEDPAGPGCS